MGLHKSFDRDFILLNGATLTEGGSLDLARGQVGIFDTEEVGVNGAKALNSFKGLPKKKLVEIRYKEHDVTASRTTSTKTHKSFPFSLEDVVELKVSAPKTTEAKVDEVIVGYNGIDPETAITFRKGEKKNMTIELSGEPIGLLGYPDNKVQVPLFFDAGELSLDTCMEDDPCLPTDCTPIIQNGLEVFKQFKLRGGISVLDYLEVSPIRSCVETVGVETNYMFYELSVCDTGDGSALGLIQQQYPGVHVERVRRNGAISVYQLMQASDDDAPVAYEQTLPSLIKGCETCPADYTEVEGGLVYAISLEDDGVDRTSAVEALANAVAGTGKKADGQSFGVGFYTVVVTQRPNAAQVATFITANPTATIDFVGEVGAICENDTITSTEWVAGEELSLTEKSFTIDLPDTNCDGLQNRLEELQAAYPTLNVTLASSTTSTRTVTLTGTSGTANIAIGGTNYLATFATNLATTANNFVNAHAAAILSTTGATVKASGSTIVVTDTTVGFPAITVTNATTNLAGTVGTITAVPVTGGCQTRYATTVKTNLRGEVCDPIFLDAYTAEAPLPYQGRQWKSVDVVTPTTGCLCGIKLKGKLMQIMPEECIIDEVGFIESSVKIRVAGGWISDIREGIGMIEDNPFNVEYLTYAENRTHLGGNLRQFERMSHTYHTGNVSTTNISNVQKFLTGETSNLNYEAQYVDYAITLKRSQFSQGMSQVHNAFTTYHIHAEVGRHQAIESLLNALAASAGVSGVQAFGSSN